MRQFAMCDDWPCVLGTCACGGIHATPHTHSYTCCRIHSRVGPAGRLHGCTSKLTCRARPATTTESPVDSSAGPHRNPLSKTAAWPAFCPTAMACPTLPRDPCDVLPSLVNPSWPNRAAEAREERVRRGVANGKRVCGRIEADELDKVEEQEEAAKWWQASFGGRPPAVELQLKTPCSAHNSRRRQRAAYRRG
eukprot:341283-Chlamydomonas_euryale.AAC.6